MIIFGIDPGSRVTGYGIICCEGSQVRHVDNGAVIPSPTLSPAQRLHYIYTELLRLLNQTRPTVVAVEEVFVANNPRSALTLGQARGVALAAAAACALPVVEYSTRLVKQAMVGYGNATKEQIQSMVRRLLSLPESAMADASDALAVAITHAHSHRLQLKTNQL